MGGGKRRELATMSDGWRFYFLMISLLLARSVFKNPRPPTPKRACSQANSDFVAVTWSYINDCCENMTYYLLSVECDLDTFRGRERWTVHPIILFPFSLCRLLPLVLFSKRKY